MIRICTSVVEAGYEVLLIGRKRGSSKPLAQQVFQQKRLKCWFNTGKLFYLEYNLRLLVYLLFAKADAYSAVDLDTLVACTFAAKVRSKKLIFDAHEYFEEVPEVTNRPLIKKTWQTVAKWFIPHVDLAYTVNRALADMFSKQYHRKFEVIRSVPYPYPQLNRTGVPTQKVILYQGALNKGRGLECLLQTVSRLDVTCWIAGEGDLSGKLRNLAADLNIKHKVKFLGYVEPDELKHLTTQVWLGYNVMENLGLSYYYSLANKFFDYIQAEIPQVCSPFPEYMQVNQKYRVAVLCDCDADQLTNTINDLLLDEAEYLNLRNQCTLAKRTFNWEDEDEKLKSLYINIV